MEVVCFEKGSQGQCNACAVMLPAEFTQAASASNAVAFLHANIWQQHLCIFVS